jgi:hypothetical protein
MQGLCGFGKWHITIVYTQVYKLNYEETVNNTTNIEELHINVFGLGEVAELEAK